MNVGTVLNSKAALYGGAILAAGIVLYFFGRKLKQTAKDAVGAIADVNRGTPYEGTGVIGTLGHATDVASGGTLSAAGSWLGSKLYDIFGDDYDPNAPVKLQSRKQAVGDNFYDRGYLQ